VEKKKKKIPRKRKRKKGDQVFNHLVPEIPVPTSEEGGRMGGEGGKSKKKDGVVKGKTEQERMLKKRSRTWPESAAPPTRNPGRGHPKQRGSGQVQGKKTPTSLGKKKQQKNSQPRGGPRTESDSLAGK